MRLALPPALVLPALTLLAASAWAAPEVTGEPHAFMADPAGCVRCHETVPQRGRDDFTSIILKKDIVTLCEECHRSMVNADKHPVDIRPGAGVPADLHLDNYFSITCVTCHDPHGRAFSEEPRVEYTLLDRLGRLVRDEKRHRTYFLRRSNVGGRLCLSCHTREKLMAAEEREPLTASNQYVGSQKCGECHEGLFKEWSKTLHARFVGDPSVNPGVVRATFEGDSPFPPGRLLYTLGEHWTQRYVVQGEKGDAQVRPEIWSVQSRQWISSGTYSRSWFRYCAGCHTTAFNPFDGTFAEKGIGCEACHGPGRRHCETTDQFDVVNPAKLTEQRRDMICESCHTSGHDRSGQYRFPVGWRPGDDLMMYYKGLVPKPGQDMSTYRGDGTYEDRHRQFHYWVANYNITQGILCDVCKNFRQTLPGEGSGEYYLTSSQYCATCHGWYWTNYTRHSKHTVRQAECIQCHTPVLAKDKRGYSIHDHKFQFGEPAWPESSSMEQRCRKCHGERKPPRWESAGALP